ncbi:MAG: HigA family addiction module antidote protein, partial [Elusimicrobiales bacterium]|nr:HigA family addiction module antidote protein [Elusimicrobiales bacterium]
MNMYSPYNVYPPGEILLEELEARGMSQSDFAEIIGRPLKTVNEIIKGKKIITAETANAIAAVLETSSEMWLGLQADYDLFLLRRKKSRQQEEIKKRAKLYSFFPVRELIKRDWIKKRKSVDNLEKEIFSLFSISG